MVCHLKLEMEEYLSGGIHKKTCELLPFYKTMYLFVFFRRKLKNTLLPAGDLKESIMGKKCTKQRTVCIVKCLLLSVQCTV